MENRVQSEQGSAGRTCALCGSTLKSDCTVSLCADCMKHADCCIGLEDTRE